MRKFWKPMLPFDISNEEQKATVKITGGPTYHRVHLITNATHDKIRRVRLLNHGVEKQSWKGSQLLYLQKYLGSFVDDAATLTGETANRVIIPFSEMECRTDEGQDFTELVTSPADSWVLEIEFAGVAEIAVKGRAERSSAFITLPDNSQHKKVRTQMRRAQTLQMQAHALGENIYADFPQSAGRRIRRMFFECADIERIIVQRDGTDIIEISDSDNKYDQLEANRKPQPGIFCFDPLVNGFGKMDLFRTMSADTELQFKVYIRHDATKPPGVIPVLVDYVEVEQQ